MFLKKQIFFKQHPAIGQTEHFEHVIGHSNNAPLNGLAFSLMQHSTLATRYNFFTLFFSKWTATHIPHGNEKIVHLNYDWLSLRTLAHRKNGPDCTENPVPCFLKEGCETKQ